MDAGRVFRVQFIDGNMTGQWSYIEIGPQDAGYRVHCIKYETIYPYILFRCHFRWLWLAHTLPFEMTTANVHSVDRMLFLQHFHFPPADMKCNISSFANIIIIVRRSSFVSSILLDACRSVFAFEHNGNRRNSSFVCLFPSSLGLCCLFNSIPIVCCFQLSCGCVNMVLQKASFPIFKTFYRLNGRMETFGFFLLVFVPDVNCQIE